MLFVTAFEPFGSATVNGSQEAVQRWAAREPELAWALLPVVRERAWSVAEAALAALPEPPKLWLMLGEAGREPQVVRLEKVALNWDDFRLPDNAGAQPRNTPIVEDGPAAYFSTLDVAALAQHLEGQTPLPVHVSLSAGAFLCNHLSYRALHARLPFPCVFVHVPAWRPEDGEAALEQLVDTLQTVAAAAHATL